MESAILRRKAVRLPLGRWRAFQHPPGRRSAMHPGFDGRYCRRQERADRRPGWLSRKRAVLEAIAVGREGPRTGGRSQAGHRRWRLGLLESDSAGVPDHPRAALLGP